MKGEVSGLTQRFLLEYEEDGIDKFDVFDIIVDHVVGDETLRVLACYIE